MRLPKLIGSAFVALLFFGCFLMLLKVEATQSYDWSKARPSQHRTFDDMLQAKNNDSQAAIGLGVTIGTYVENDPGHGYNDSMSIRVGAIANSRVGINYQCDFLVHGYQWIDVSQSTGISQDNGGVWLNLGFPFLYYGVEYSQIWVCSNGFVSVRSNYTDANPQSIPDSNTPNGIIAPFWRDLRPNAGGSIKYGTATYPNANDHYCFIVSWVDVPDIDDQKQTFQLLIEQRNGYATDMCHNMIFFQYKNITKNRPTIIGMEDQLGTKAYTLQMGDVNNNGGKYLHVSGPTGFRLTEIEIVLSKFDGQAWVNPVPQLTCGYNVQLEDTSNPYGGFWGALIENGATLIGGAVMDGLFLIYDLASSYASAQYSNATEQHHGSTTSENDSWSQATCYAEQAGEGQGPNGEPFDSELASSFDWFFTDNNNANHSLTVTAYAHYFNLDTYQGFQVSACVTLNLYTGYHYFETHALLPGGSEASAVSIRVNSTQYYTPVSTTLADGTYSVLAESLILGGNYRFNVWSDAVYDNPRTVVLHGDWIRSAIYEYIGGGGGGDGCPTLFTWNGTGHVSYGVLNIHDSSGEDLVKEQSLDSEDVSISSWIAKFVLCEGWPGLNFSESVIDQVKLYAVDKCGSRYLCPLVSAIHSQEGNVLLNLLFSDDWKTQTLLLETIDLRFIVPYPQQMIRGYTFVLEGCNQMKL